MKLQLTGHRIRTIENGMPIGPVRFTAPIDDLLGLARRGSEGKAYLEILERRYGRRAVEQLEALGPPTVLRAVEVAAGAAVNKRIALPPLLARKLAEVEISLGDVPSVLPDDDLVALVAFTLLVTAIDGRDFSLVTCPKCGAPWVGPVDEPDYCLRPAPGGLARSCRVVHNEERLLDRDTYAAYRREYKRITEALRRGSISREDAVAWRDENAEDFWLPFEEWRIATTRGRQGEEVVSDG